MLLQRSTDPASYYYCVEVGDHAPLPYGMALNKTALGLGMYTDNSCKGNFHSKLSWRAKVSAQNRYQKLRKKKTNSGLDIFSELSKIKTVYEFPWRKEMS